MIFFCNQLENLWSFSIVILLSGKWKSRAYMIRPQYFDCITVANLFNLKSLYLIDSTQKQWKILRIVKCINNNDRKIIYVNIYKYRLDVRLFQ